MNSYESSKWYIKIWRKRWYFYIPFLFIKLKLLKFRFLGLLIEYPSKSDRKDLINSWFDIKKHIELTKMYKYLN